MNQCAQKLLVVILTSIVFILYQGVECKVLNQNNNRPQWTTHQDKVIGGADYKEHKKVLEYFDEYYEDSLEDSAINTPHHYLGQEQHLDDDGDPRYITEDDVEESYNYDSEDTRHPGPKIIHLDPRCPDLPVQSKLTENLCKAKSCLNDDDCRHHHRTFSKSSSSSKKPINTLGGRDLPPPTYICCFNGCLHTCLPKVEPPIAFDWLEETEVKRVHSNKTSEDGGRTSGLYFTPGGFPSADLSLKTMDSEEHADGIHLPGGCYITQKQLHELRLFRKFEHVETCTCFNGEVVCQINPKISLKPDELQDSSLLTP